MMDDLKSNVKNVRKQMGYLKFSNNRSYPIYEGLNIIGRDVKATIRVKDLTLSKQHAIISVINDNTCFISDFDSSNGTHIRNIKLIPFKLYEIHNHETVIFGDIIASYHTTNLLQSSVEQDVTIANESQIPATQILPHNFHDIPTQKLNDKNQSQNIHFEETQLVHDADTQLRSKQPSCTKTIDDQNEVNSNASDIFDDVIANETLKQSLQNRKYDLVVDETIPNESNSNNNVTLEDDIILSTQDNDMIDKKAMELQQNEKATKESVDSDDSETDIENEEEFLRNIKEKSTQIYDIIKDSDPKTNVEDNFIKTSNSSTAINTIVNNNIVISDDEEELDLLADNIHSDTSKNNDDDDDLLFVPTQLLQNEQSNNIEKHTENDNDDLLAPTQLLSTKNEKNNIENDNDDDLLAPIQLLSTKNPVENDNDDDMLAPTQLLQCRTSNDQVDDEILAPTQLLSANNHQTKTNEDEDDMDSLAPTQLLSTKNKNNAGECETDDNLLAPTQLLSTKNGKNNIENDNDDDLLAPTQLLQHKSNDDQTDNEMLAPTQLLSTKNHQKPVDDDLTPKQLLLQNDNDDENEMLAPTQLLQSKSKKTEVFNDDDDALPPTQLLQSKNQNDSIYSAPTQLLDKATPKKSCIFDIKSPRSTQKKSVNFSENIFDAPTQKLVLQNKPSIETIEEMDIQSSSSSNPSNSINNSQDIRLVLSETDDEIFPKKVPQNTTEPETQLEVDFQLETQKLYVEQKTSRPDNPLAHMFDEEPTQMTEEMDKNELPNIETERKLQIKLKDMKDFKESSNVTRISSSTSKKNIEQNQRSQQKLQDLKESSSSKSTTSSTSDESDLKAEGRQKRGRKPKIDKLNITKVKSKPDNIKSEEDEIPKISRNRRTSNQQPAAVQIEVKNTRVSELKKSARLPNKSIVDKNETSSDMDDFIVMKTRNSKRGRRAQKIDKTEDDTEEVISPKKKVKKLEYTEDDSCSEVIHEKPVKRSMKIEDYSSDENSNSTITTSIYLDTPNTKRRRFDPLNITVNDSIKHKIVFTMLNDTELENSVKKLGGSIVDNVNTCTALVTNKISRSLKFLIAVALGKPIVQPKWILDSVKKNSFQDPWNYILEDKETESKFNFSLKESLKKSCEKKLLADLVILLATKKNSDVLKEIIETSGGKCIQRAPGKNGKAIVVSYEDEKSKYSKYLKQKSLTVVAAEAIFSGVLQQELKLNEHLLV